MSDNEDNQPRKKQKMSFSEIPNWKSSHDEKKLLSKKYVLCKNFQDIGSCGAGEVILRVESGYDPEFALANGKMDNISRRWLKCNLRKFVSSQQWPVDNLSFHEVIKNTSEVKLFGDLDGFKGSSYIDMLKTFQCSHGHCYLFQLFLIFYHRLYCHL